MASSTQGTAPPPQTFRVTRSGAKDLQFGGFLLGQANRSPHRPDLDDSGLAVSVYATVGGKYITHVERADMLGETKSSAAVHDTPDAAYAWLVADNRGKLGPVSKLAWTEACQRWPALAGQDVEVIA